MIFLDIIPTLLITIHFSLFLCLVMTFVFGDDYKAYKRMRRLQEAVGGGGEGSMRVGSIFEDGID
jgi:hypothetical protein